MLKGSPCHPECNENVEKRVREAVAAFVGPVQIQSVCVQPEAVEPVASALTDESRKENFTHHFLLTVTTCCPCDSKEVRAHVFPANNQLSLGEMQVYENPGNMLMSSLNETLTCSPAMDDSLLDSTNSYENSDALLDNMDFSMDDEGSYVDIDTSHTDSQDDFEERSTTFYPMSRNLLHEAITSQLDKLPLRYNEWSSPLFNELASSSSDLHNIQESMDINALMNHLDLTEQQSSEISSSTLDSFANNYSPEISTVKFPEYAGSRQHQTGNENLLQLSVLPSQHGISPACLPAASTYSRKENGSSSMNWKVVTENKISTVVEITGPVQRNRKNGRCTHTKTIVETMIPVSSSTSPSQLLTQSKKYVPAILKPAAYVTSSQSSLSSGSSFLGSPINEQERLPANSNIVRDLNAETMVEPNKNIQSEKGKRVKSKRKGLISEVELKVHHLTGEVKKAPRFWCPTCDKGYSSANGFKYHLENGHGPKKTYTCEVCDKVYGSKQGLNVHFRQHSKTS